MRIMNKYLLFKTRVLAWTSITFFCVALSSCSPYNGNREHDTRVVVKQYGDRSKSSADILIDLMEYGYDRQTAQEIMNDAFHARLNGDY